MPMKPVLLASIRFYQKVLSRETGWLSKIYPKQTCRFHPTCSQYAYEAIDRYGTVKGSWLGIRRLLRCHPWNNGGIDPVPKP